LNLPKDFLNREVEICYSYSTTDFSDFRQELFKNCQGLSRRFGNPLNRFSLNNSLLKRLQHSGSAGRFSKPVKYNFTGF
jgi:hypothetical protein